ncbi:MAG: ATP synthase F1 subunit delta [Candidatus Dormibacteria bacterium]
MLTDAAVRPYARAVFEIAREDGDLDGWVAQVGLVEDLVSDEVLDAAVDNPQVGEEARFGIAERLRPDGMSQTAFNLARLLIANHRTRQARSLRDQLTEMVDRAQGRVAVRVRSAVELEPAQLDELSAQIRSAIGLEPRLLPEVDPTLLGGLLVQVGDRVLDLSLRGRLRSMESWIASGS